MQKLFGLEIAIIAGVLTALLILVVISLALLAWRRPVFFKLGIRPIPRRKAQSALIVLGLMLATLIITAAFITGDTLSHTIRVEAIQGVGNIDEMIKVGGGSSYYGRRNLVDPYFKVARYESLKTQLDGYQLIDQMLPAIQEYVPAINITRKRSLRSIEVSGLRPEDVSILPQEEIIDINGNPIGIDDLKRNEVYINKAAAEKLEAAPGDLLELYVSSKPKVFTVRAISAQSDNPRLILSLRQAQILFNQRGRINLIVISNLGDELGGVNYSQEVTAHLRGLLSDPLISAQIYSFLSGDPKLIQGIREAAENEDGNTQSDLLALADGLDAGKLSPRRKVCLPTLTSPTTSNRFWSILIGAARRCETV